MPVLAVDEGLDHAGDSILESDVRAATRVLAVGLDCRYAHIGNPSLQNTSHGGVALSIRIRDQDFCAAQVDLRATFGCRRTCWHRPRAPEIFGELGKQHQQQRLDMEKIGSRICPIPFATCRRRLAHHALHARVVPTLGEQRLRQRDAVPDAARPGRALQSATP